MGYEVVGTWRQFFHWGPILALSVVFIISWITVRCHLMWWPPWESLGALLNITVFLMWVTLTLYNYFAACLKGPGFIPQSWTPKDPNHKNYLQFCEECEGCKAPRSHHCRKCQRCVMKMDHHCPWINTCCGHYNHANFTLFLLFAPIGCIHGLIILIPSVYRALNFQYYYYYRSQEPLVYLGFFGFVLTMFGIGLAIGVIIAVGMLFYIQMKSILKNETGIETWIVDKAYDRDRGEEEGEFIYPYNLGWRENLKQVFTWSGKPKSSGFRWDVRPECHQFSLTIEQLMQKREKRERTMQFKAKRPYSGSMFPIFGHGCRTGCCVPCTDEARLKLDTGDIIHVTRWKKRWLYGCKVISTCTEEKQVVRRIRGWFPRHCGVRIDDENDHDKKLS
ncbi:palmitoyltransferase [Plakobranchus ocellatus]|uniref:Palmitoyltransferase n=1 Tax=Plakobranchus ocellatus TaxID=259542 RepID=A0AAV4D3G0_9GAST|nr:palmitoyltransferase [Plakobranchus ocellatus]